MTPSTQLILNQGSSTSPLMDPLSITVSCIALINATNRTYKLVGKVCNAQRDLAVVSGELNELKKILESLKKILKDLREESENTDAKGDNTTPTQQARSLPDNINSNIGLNLILDECVKVLTQLDSVLAKQLESRVPSLRWAAGREGEVVSLKKQLNAHTKALNIALLLSQWVTTQAIKADIRQQSSGIQKIQDDTAAIRSELDAVRDGNRNIIDQIGQLRVQSVSREAPNTPRRRPRRNVSGNALDQILTEIAQLRDMLPPTAAAETPQKRYKNQPTDGILEQYLDSATSYANTILGDNDRDHDLPPWDSHQADDPKSTSESREPFPQRQDRTDGRSLEDNRITLTRLFSSTVPVTIRLVLNVTYQTNLRVQHDPYFTRDYPRNKQNRSIAVVRQDPNRRKVDFFDLSPDCTDPEKRFWTAEFRHPLVRVASQMARFVDYDPHEPQIRVTDFASKMSAVLDLEDFDQLFNGSKGIFIHGLEMSPDGKNIAAIFGCKRPDAYKDDCKPGKVIVVWSLYIADSTSEEGAKVLRSRSTGLSKLSDNAREFAFLSNSKRVIIRDPLDGTGPTERFRLWHFGNDESRDVVKFPPQLFGSSNGYEASILNQVGYPSYLSRWDAALQGAEIKELDLNTGQYTALKVILRTSEGEERLSASTIVSNYGDLLIAQVVRNGVEQMVQVWNISKARLQCGIRLPWSYSTSSMKPSVALSDDGEYLSCIYQKQVVVWKLEIAEGLRKD